MRLLSAMDGRLGSRIGVTSASSVVKRRRRRTTTHVEVAQVPSERVEVATAIPSKNLHSLPAPVGYRRIRKAAQVIRGREGSGDGDGKGDGSDSPTEQIPVVSGGEHASVKTAVADLDSPGQDGNDDLLDAIVEGEPVGGEEEQSVGRTDSAQAGFETQDSGGAIGGQGVSDGDGQAEGVDSSVAENVPETGVTMQHGGGGGGGSALKSVPRDESNVEVSPETMINPRTPTSTGKSKSVTRRRSGGDRTSFGKSGSRDA